jgi:alpha-L-fucosidase 2
MFSKRSLFLLSALSLLFFVSLCNVEARKAPPPVLWFNHPATQWDNALPIGNGRMGAMVFGGVPDERIQFNQDTLWRGHPHDYVRGGAHDYLAEIRQLIFEGKTKEAADVVRKHFLSDPVRQMPYQPFGDLHFHFIGYTNVTDYRRELDLDSAIARVTYRADGISYQRDAFASYPDRVIVLRFTANKPGHISFTLKMDSPQTNSHTRAISPDTLALSGQVQPHGLRFESRVRVITVGGQISTNGNFLAVNNADSATVLLVADTSFKNFQDISGNPDAWCAKAMARLDHRSYDSLLSNHLADYTRLFKRVTFNLGHYDRTDLPTDERLELVRKYGLEGDPALAALYFQFGRYLLIASSRSGGQPANLQGIWNDELNPPWECKWTLNINCEMNYWPAEAANLDECTKPLFAMINDLVISGGRTAREQYQCRGWVVHHNTDLWRGTAPINNIDGMWPTGGAWLCHCLWEYYLFTGDTNFLARYYPDMKQASLFFVDFLIKDPKTGWLVTSPSYSPEHGTLCYGPTMDNQLIRALFNSTIAAAKILGKDREFAATLVKLRDQLPPNQVGKYGQLQEWITDIDKPYDNHRHMSPLWALYPGSNISPANPKIWNAAKLLLKWRGDGSTGWSYAWRIALWARVDDGEFAWRQLNLLFQRKTLPNLLDLCGPFQIDGNFGATAGMIEMLLQSQWTEMRHGHPIRIVQLLPALPKKWPSGSISGICARDGFVVDLAWENGQLTRAVIHSKLGLPCLLRYGGHEIELKTEAGKTYALNGELKPITP